MTEFRNTQLPEFKLGINGAGLRSNQSLIQRDLTSFYQQKDINKPIVVPKQPEPNIFFTPIEDNREQILRMMKKELDSQLEFTRTYIPSDRR